MKAYSDMTIAELEAAIIEHEAEAKAARAKQAAAHSELEQKRKALPPLEQGMVLKPGDDWGAFFKSLPPAAIEAFKSFMGK